MQKTVEEKWRKWQLGPQTLNLEPPAEPAHRLLERHRDTGWAKSKHFAVQNQLPGRHAADGFDHFRHGRSHIAQRAGEHSHFVRDLCT